MIIRHSAAALAVAAAFPAAALAAGSAAAPIILAAAPTEQPTVVITATRAVEPLVHARDLADGATVVAIGSYRPDMIEVDPSVFARARIVVADDVSAVLTESGDVIRAISEGVLRAEDVGALGASDADIGEEGVRVVKSVGTAALDWAIAAAAYRRAVRPGATGGTT